MLFAHSPLWYYLWIAPNLLLLILAYFLWARRLYKQYPFFFAFLITSAVDQLVLYIADVSPSVTAEIWWLIFWAGLILEGVLKFAVIGEIFSHAFSSYASVARLGKVLIRALGVVLILAAALAAAFAPHDSTYGIVSGAHLLEQTIYIVETGLLAFILVFSAYFRLGLARPVLGIAIGLSVSACVHLATWAVLANGGLPDTKRVWLDFLNMATFHVCVLIWFYYLLVPLRVSAKPSVPLPENNLAVWNRELERLLQQ